jgi:dihydrofolate reductase
MGKIVISTNATLDGVVQDPDGKEGSARGGWFTRFGGADLEAWAKAALEEILAAEALLLGRRSDAWFAERWLARSGAWAERMNGIPKYVVSSSLGQARWSNASVLKGDVPAEAARLKQELGGEILVYASSELTRTLLQHHLVDEIRLMVLPVVVGTGERLFDGISDFRPLRLVDSQTLGEGLAHLTFQTVPAA